jgi:hypothetical protein
MSETATIDRDAELREHRAPIAAGREEVNRLERAIPKALGARPQQFVLARRLEAELHAAKIRLELAEEAAQTWQQKRDLDEYETSAKVLARLDAQSIRLTGEYLQLRGRQVEVAEALHAVRVEISALSKRAADTAQRHGRPLVGRRERTTPTGRPLPPDARGLLAALDAAHFVKLEEGAGLAMSVETFTTRTAARFAPSKP